MLIRSQGTTLLQIFCELKLYSQVIFKSMRVADDTFKRNSECEWVKFTSFCFKLSHLGHCWYYATTEPADAFGGR